MTIKIKIRVRSAHPVRRVLRALKALSALKVLQVM